MALGLIAFRWIQIHPADRSNGSFLGVGCAPAGPSTPCGDPSIESLDVRLTRLEHDREGSRDEDRGVDPNGHAHRESNGQVEERARSEETRSHHDDGDDRQK